MSEVNEINAPDLEGSIKSCGNFLYKSNLSIFIIKEKIKKGDNQVLNFIKYRLIDTISSNALKF